MKLSQVFLIAALLLAAAFQPGFAADQGKLPTPNRGTVAETIDTPDYIYIRVKSAKGEEWLAAPQQVLPVGTAIAWSDGAAMTNFKSMRLNRSFDSISFVDVVVKTK
ncbi:MAG: hypothetical protein K2X44_06025 [Magnetospirillum sp.]|nr:hypothetical protein [Magnetospirillum sp.]